MVHKSIHQFIMHPKTKENDLKVLLVIVSSNLQLVTYMAKWALINVSNSGLEWPLLTITL